MARGGMTVFFESGELYKAATQMERNGLAYYVVAAGLARDEETRAVYQYLASSEKRHPRTFRKLWTQSRHSSPPESYKGEYKNYLKTLLEDRIFPSSASARARAAKSRPLTALSTGIKAEKDSILFYSEMVDVVSPSDRDQVAKILAEEKRHLASLLKYKLKSRCLK
jgi:rubrerythrin